MRRGLFIAAVQALLGFISLEVGWPSDTGIVMLVPVTTMAGSLFWGAWDRFGRRHLPSA